MKDVEYYMEHPEEFEQLSEEEQAKLYEGETEEGASPDPENPAEEPTEESEEDREKEPDPVVLAKDGKNVIPYSELEKARDTARKYEQMVRDQQSLIESLKAAQQEDQGTGDTKAQDAVIAEYSGEYPELMEDLKPYLEKMVTGSVQALEAKLASIEAKLAPVEKDAAERAARDHFSQIAAKHPDYEEVASSDEFKAWLDSQPSFMRDQCMAVARNGTAAQVIELLDLFREAHPKDGLAKEQLVKQAKEKVPKPPAPKSLSEIPGATAAHHDEAEAIREMSDLALMGKFNNMSPDQIEAMLNRLI